MIKGTEIQRWMRRQHGFTVEAAAQQVNRAVRMMDEARYAKGKGISASFYVKQARQAWRNARVWQAQLAR